MNFSLMRFINSFNSIIFDEITLIRLSKKNSTLQWILLALISMSVTVTTFHSHHRLRWNLSKHQADTGTNISRDATLCPISGYLFSAQIAGRKTAIAAISVSAHVVMQSETQHIDPFFGDYCGRSPPLAG